MGPHKESYNDKTLFVIVGQPNCFTFSFAAAISLSRNGGFSTTSQMRSASRRDSPSGIKNPVRAIFDRILEPANPGGDYGCPAGHGFQSHHAE